MPAPHNAELEVAVFGPGYGECVLVHVGNGKWIVIDSCIYRGQREPEALRYLADLGVDPAQAIIGVVATHWHDDHIRGLSRLLAAAPSARFFCPAAFSGRDFLTLVAHGGRSVGVASGGIEEMRAVLQELETRNQDPVWVLEDATLYEDVVTFHERKLPIVLKAASPSHAAFSSAAVGLARQFQSRDPVRRVTSGSPNHCAIVIHAQLGEQALLLGSDLEVCANPRDGWTQVTTYLGPRPRSRLIKVAHHGSETGHHDPVWEALLFPRPIGVLTPFRHGRVSLPTNKDVDRLLGAVSSLHITCDPRTLVQKSSNKVVQSLLAQTLTSPLIAQATDAGVVRARAAMHDPLAPWSVEMIGGACELTRSDENKTSATG